ncbi:MAG: UvrD-helicase domain-containing protein [Bacteroidetes bacterium]|nr:UvrD-helicase domain-containing protein [Bacteroidota bacterium]
MGDLFKDLNEEQRKAVEFTDGPVMVIAGAGSGKTRVLTYRVAYLLELDVDAFNILALTFTNKAAREMKERIIRLVGGTEAHNVWMGTFHSIFAKVLRIEGHYLGYPPNYTIYDTDDSKRLIKTILKENNLDDKQYPPSYILNRISAAKTSLIAPQEYNSNTDVQDYDSSSGKPLTGQLYQQYQSKLFRASAMDFDDLLFNMNVLLRDFPDVLYKYQQKFHYILVDEYQDTNYAQYLIVKKLAANNENLCVVGDDAQSIYSFRGANIQNILNFKSDYPDLKVFKLEQNYRSTKTIVSVANSIIVNNKKQIFKEIWTENEEGPKITLLHASTDTEEGNLVAQSIFENKMNNQLPNASFVILYRTNAQSRSHEEALRRLNIPCRIYGGLSFYQRKEIKDVLAYYHLAINHKDDGALLRIINYPARGIGKTTVEKLIVTADKYKRSIFEIISDPAGFPVDISSGTLAKMSMFATMIESFTAQLTTRSAFDLAKHIVNSTGLLKELYVDKTPEGVSRIENIEELLNSIKEFTENPVSQDLQVNDLQFDPGLKATTPDPQTEATGPVIKTLGMYLQDVALLTDMDYDDNENQDKVLLMTIHAAKGLEFPYVYLVGLEENLFPSIQSLGSRADLEEERRLFYVAITRAQKKLTLSYAENRYKWGDLTICEPSRFINEVPEQYIDFPKRTSIHTGTFQSKDNFSNMLTGVQESIRKPLSMKNFKKVTPVEDKGSGDTGDLEEIQPGREVEHERFGKGKVISLEGNGPNKKATVFFAGIGQKQLLLRFAKLKLL